MYNISYKKFYNIYKIQNIWETIYNQNENLSVFQEFFYSSKIFNMTLYKRGRINQFFIFYNNNEPIVIVPLVKKLLPKKGRDKWLMFGDIQGCDITDFIYKKDLSLELMKAVILKLREICKEKFTMKRINENSLVLKALKSLYPNSTFEPYKYVKLPEVTNIEDYIASLSRNTRQNVRKAYHRLENDNIPYKFVTYYPTSLAPKKLFDECLDVYINRQINQFNNKRLGSIWLTNWYFKYKKHDTISVKKSPYSCIFALLIQNKVAATMMGYINRDGGIAIPRVAINPEFNYYSPGRTLIVEMNKFIINHKEFKYIDLTRGDEKYKYDMGGIEYYTYTFCFPE